MNGPAAAAMATVVPRLAMATGTDQYEPFARDQWLSEASPTEMIETRGWQVRRMKVYGDCREVYGTTPGGERVGCYFHPAPGDMLFMNQRGRIIFRADNREFRSTGALRHPRTITVMAPWGAWTAKAPYSTKDSERAPPVHRLIEPVTTRRTMLIGLGATGVGLVASPAIAGDRPMTSTGRTTVVNYAGVRVSDKSGRTATVADFASAESCRLSRNTVEGRYFICSDVMNARNVAEDLDGTPMTLAIRVTDPGCTPVPGAIVDVWQRDASGNCSGHAVDPDSPPGVNRGRPREPDISTRFLRGVLATDADGIVEFGAICPGYYNRRVTHTHYKVHVGNTEVLSSQALYPEERNARTSASPVYSEGRGKIRVLNANDGLGRTAVLFTISVRGDRLSATVRLSTRVWASVGSAESDWNIT